MFQSAIHLLNFELSIIYCEWVYYLCYIEQIGDEKQDDTGTLNNTAEANETGKVK